MGHVSEFLIAGTVFPRNVTKKITERYGKIGRGVFAQTRSSREAARLIIIALNLRSDSDDGDDGE